MCGIAGYISSKLSTTPVDLKAANALLVHRGPDSGGYYFSADHKTGLAHRRLSILDLSKTADQPMASSNGRYQIVYNGEVYNFKELRKKLPDGGGKLKTTSDTEVIIELFSIYGPACFSWLNGMFAMAILDTQLNTLTLCRDHVGIKPLFVYCNGADIIFSSELKAIVSIRKDILEVNKQAIPYFLHLGFIPQPFTIYKDVIKFPSGSYCQVNINTSEPFDIINSIIPFWTIGSKILPDPLTDASSAKKQLSDLLFDSVEKQLVSDVPIGTFLSGGVDSSIVTAIASKVSDQKINTFSIGIDDGKYNESGYARKVADHLKTTHHEFHVKEKEVMELIDSLLPAYDEPFADTSAFPTMMVSRMAKQNVTVALSGDGGDELFMGYGSHIWAQRLANPVVKNLRKPLFTASKSLSNKYQRAGHLFDHNNDATVTSHVFSQEQYFFKENELQGLLKNIAFDFHTLNKVDTGRRKFKADERQSVWDFNNYLKDDLLVKVDRASMVYSLETRVPLLDFRIVEFAYNLSRDLKVRNGTMKYILKEVLYDHVPRKFFDRPKWGFSIPLVKWLKTDLRYLIDKYSSREVIEKHDLLHFEYVVKIRDGYLNGKDYLYNRLWVIVVLHWWLESNAS